MHEHSVPPPGGPQPPARKLQLPQLEVLPGGKSTFGLAPTEVLCLGGCGLIFPKLSDWLEHRSLRSCPGDKFIPPPKPAPEIEEPERRRPWRERGD